MKAFVDWIDHHPWAWVLAFVLLIVVICGPIVWVVVTTSQDRTARCEAHGWEYESVRGGGFCVRPDGVLVEIPER